MEYIMVNCGAIVLPLKDEYLDLERERQGHHVCSR